MAQKLVIDTDDPNIFDLNKFDKTNFVCLKFPDSSMYYGEVAYFDSDGAAVTKKSPRKS